MERRVSLRDVHSSGLLAVDASDIGFPAGTIPQRVSLSETFELAHTEIFDGDIVWWDLASGSGVTLRVFND